MERAGDDPREPQVYHSWLEGACDLPTSCINDRSQCPPTWRFCRCVSDGDLIVYSNKLEQLGLLVGTGAKEHTVGDFMDVIAVPLDKPAEASSLGSHSPVQNHGPCAPAATTPVRSWGDVKKAVLRKCRHDQRWDFGADVTPGGGPKIPTFSSHSSNPAWGSRAPTGRRHSTVITWDGEAIVAGRERGGGAEAECEAAA